MQTTGTENINNHFFEGIYKEIWRQVIPEGLTRAENDWILQETNLQPGNRLMDLMCGYGRNTLALARKGIQVSAIDNLRDYVEEIRWAAQNENLPVESLQQDVLNLELQGKFDAAICMGNSICFFDAGDLAKIFLRVSDHLKPGASFIICSWRLNEIVANGFREKTWSYVGNVKFLADSRFLLSPSRIESKNIFIAPDGKTEEKTAIDYIYSLNETEQLLNLAGFILKDVWSIPAKKKFILGESRAYIVAEKK
jgi:SAM-dependent methyltransferase